MIEREIKFRAWDKNYSDMIWFSLWDAHFNFNWVRTKIRPKKEDIIFMQYTGMKDKNDKEIYEGDIIRHIHSKGIVIVEWTTDKWIGYNIRSTDNMEVIGNIYENPNCSRCKS